MLGSAESRRNLGMVRFGFGTSVEAAMWAITAMWGDGLDGLGGCL